MIFCMCEGIFFHWTAQYDLEGEQALLQPYTCQKPTALIGVFQGENKEADREAMLWRSSQSNTE